LWLQELRRLEDQKDMRTALRLFVALGTVLALALPAAGVVAAAGVSISPNSGAIGTGASVSGSGFAGMTTVDVHFGGRGGPLIGAESTDTNGNFSNLAVTIPNVTGGTYQIFASDGSNTATTDFTVPSSLTLNPTSGSPGTGVSVSGTGFLSGENVVVGWDNDDNQVASATANSNGGFSTNFNVPNSANGSHTVFATGQSSGFQVTATFTVNNSNVGGANVSLSPTSGPAGSNVTLTGSGYNANETVNISVDGGMVTSVTSDGNGNFSTVITLSSSLSTGGHTITATGASSGHSASATFTVTSGQTTTCTGDDERPGNGFGDDNHCHTGPPGHHGDNDQGDNDHQDNHGHGGDHGRHGDQGGNDQGEDD
jgi:hypothetical protein